MIFQKTEAVLVTAGEAEGHDFVNVTLITKDSETAQCVSDILRGILALGKLLVQEEPKIASIIGAMKTDQDRNKINIRYQIPAEELFTTLKHLEGM